MIRTARDHFAALILVGACAVGCPGSGFAATSAIAADSSEKTLDLTITGGAVPAAQRLLRVQKNDAVRLRVTSDAPGEIHLHAYRVQAALAPGAPAEFSFVAFATGRYRIEWHPASARGEPPVGHHAPPLATLEVRPR